MHTLKPLRTVEAFQRQKSIELLALAGVVPLSKSCGIAGLGEPAGNHVDHARNWQSRGDWPRIVAYLGKRGNTPPVPPMRPIQVVVGV